MQPPLTLPQQRALDFIRNRIVESGSAPTLRELCAYMKYKAIGSAQDLVSALRKKGYLETPDRQSARSLLLTEKSKQYFNLLLPISSDDNLIKIPCLGSVPAGNPLEAIEEQIDVLQMSASMLPRPLPKPESLFAVKTSGNSMINAGILDGDWLVVKVQSDAEPGNIVVARVSGEVTCKRLMKDVRRGWFLKPENESFSNFFASDDPFEIVGRVVALQRSL